MGEAGTQVNTVRWGKFLENLKRAGVEVAYTAEGNFAYLRREMEGRVLSAPLPSNFNADNPDAIGLVGPFVFDSICRKLELDKHKHFNGWYIVY